jgi:pre-mRNA-splicing factor 18
MNSLKQKLEFLKKKVRKNNSNDVGYIRYKDIIEEKLKENKEEQIYIKKKIFPIKKQKTSEDEKKEKERKDGIFEEEILNFLKEKENIKKEKTFISNINPSEIIREIKDNDEKKRIIEVEKYTNEYKCKELYNWFHLTFIEWEKSLSEEIKNKIDTNELHSKLGIYKQCRGYIKTLLIHLKEKTVPQFILDKLFEIMVFCIDRDYIRANDNYIDLSIGDAPWPMGVTMVGIHERTGRSRIYNSQVAYILNDDITKKYLQSVKRVMSFIQRNHPKHPSQSVYS